MRLRSLGLKAGALALVGIAVFPVRAAANHEFGHPPSVVVDEPAGFARVKVTYGTCPREGAVIEYATEDGPARGGQDYKPVSGRLVLAEGIDYFDVPIVDDDVPEPDEAFSVKLAYGSSSPPEVVGGPCYSPAARVTGKIRIVDDDAPKVATAGAPSTATSSSAGETSTAFTTSTTTSTATSTKTVTGPATTPLASTSGESNEVDPSLAGPLTGDVPAVDGLDDAPAGAASHRSGLPLVVGALMGGSMLWVAAVRRRAARR
ncbi:MAG TPA: Calx-beta domain-containing protein [Acidimicrobiales bacterium]|nr:Calx-beta domain-containing protein [Acidimicrobiales bacterium]